MRLQHGKETPILVDTKIALEKTEIIQGTKRIKSTHTYHRQQELQLSLQRGLRRCFSVCKMSQKKEQSENGRSPENENCNCQIWNLIERVDLQILTLFLPALMYAWETDLYRLHHLGCVVSDFWLGLAN